MLSSGPYMLLFTSGDLSTCYHWDYGLMILLALGLWPHGHDITCIAEVAIHLLTRGLESLLEEERKK